MAPLEDSQQVFEHMNKHMVKFIFDGEEQEYLPKSIFDEVTTRDVIRLLVSKDDDLYLNLGEEEEFVDKAYRSGRKLFAACVFGDIPLTCLKKLLDKGLTDRDFPLIEDHCPALKLKRKFVSSFLPNQKRFNATYFGLGSFQNLDKNAVKPIEYQPLDSNNRLGGGSFGSVIQVRIHPDHRDFKLVSNRDKDVFAMKVVSREGRDQKFNQAMATLPHPHLLQCLASFTFSKEYFMIYERADSDLENFMCRNSDAGSLSDFEETDLVTQLCGLASAVSMIHNQGNDPNTLLVPHSDLTGYNHDIKPDNILMFVYNRDGKKTYWLRLADHSLAKVNEYNKKNRESHRTNGKLGTLTFQAPESDAGKGISRPYDIWSLGCVWLEFLVWYREGYSALDAFRDARISESNPGPISDDRFYNLNPDEQPELRPSVVKKIQELKANCQGPLKEIADIIPAMLEIDYNKRPNAHKLVKLLEHLYSGEDAPPEVVSVEDYPDVPMFGSPQPSVSDSESEFEGFILTRPT